MTKKAHGLKKGQFNLRKNKNQRSCRSKGRKKKYSFFCTSHQHDQPNPGKQNLNMCSSFSGNRCFHKKSPLFSLSFPILCDTIQCGISIWSLKSTALLMSPLHHLPTLSVLDLGERVDSPDAVPALLRIKQNFSAISVLSQLQHSTTWTAVRKINCIPARPSTDANIICGLQVSRT